MWSAGLDDCFVAGEMLHDFNTEYGEQSPGPAALAARLAELIDGEHTFVVMGDLGQGPASVAVVRLRPALWTTGLEAYLAELYVRPAQRGRRLGRAVLEEVLRLARAAGADRIELGTSDDDHAARALYERMGFSNREGESGPVMYVYEREL